MKFLKVALAATAITAFATSAQAQDTGTYASLGAQLYTIDSEDAFEVDGLGSSYTAVAARLGYNFSKNFGAEVEYAVGLSGPSDTVTDGDGDDLEADVELRSSAAIFLVGRTAISDNVDLFGRAGYGTIKVKAETDYVDDQFDEFNGIIKDESNGALFGAGIIYNIGSAGGIRAGYTYHANVIEGSASIFDVSYTHNF